MLVTRWLNQPNWKILLMAEILHQLRLVVYPIVYKVLYIPGGCLGFQPSTVLVKLDHFSQGLGWKVPKIFETVYRIRFCDRDLFVMVKTWLFQRLLVTSNQRITRSRIESRGICFCDYFQSQKSLPSLQLTWHLKIGLPNRKVVFQPSIFRGYVRFREGKLWGMTILPELLILTPPNNEAGTWESSCPKGMSSSIQASSTRAHFEVLSIYTYIHTLHIFICVFIHIFMFEFQGLVVAHQINTSPPLTDAHLKALMPEKTPLQPLPAPAVDAAAWPGMAGWKSTNHGQVVFFFETPHLHESDVADVSVLGRVEVKKRVWLKRRVPSLWSTDRQKKLMISATKRF